MLSLAGYNPGCTDDQVYRSTAGAAQRLFDVLDTANLSYDLVVNSDNFSPSEIAESNHKGFRTIELAHPANDVVGAELPSPSRR